MDFTAKTFVEELKVPTYFVNAERKITIPSIFLLLQEAAWLHASQHGFGYEHLQAKGLFWVLSKIKLVMYRYPQWGDTLRLETWGKEPETLTAFRDFEGWVNNEIYFTATSSWHILSLSTGRPQRMDDFRDHFPVPAGKHAIEEKLDKLPVPENPQQATALAVVPSDIDMNLHVNNTKYIEWGLDSFGFDFTQQHTLSEIEVNFLQQAKAGDSYTVATSAISNTEFISSVLRTGDGKELARMRTKWNKY